MKSCIVCGRMTFCDKHHPDKKNKPDWTVVLCPSCHRECHSGAFITCDNNASRAAWDWYSGEIAAGQFVHPHDHQAKLKELGYKPAFDFQIEMGFSSEQEWGEAVRKGEIHYGELSTRS